jgi:hypothetical protein
MTMQQPLRFEITPQPGENARSCAALVVSAVPKSRGTWFFVALCLGVALASFILPASRASTFLVGLAAVYAAVYGLQAVGRANLRQLQDQDPHSQETQFVEIGPDEIHTGCAHVSARYPWREFAKVFENTEFYLFMRATGGGAAVPKRILDAAKDEELRARIRDWSPDRGAGLARVVTRPAI